LKSENNLSEDEQYYKVLELTPGASLTDVRKAYIRLKELYSSESLAIMAIEDESSDERNAQILAQIQEAYHRLRSLFEKDEHTVKGRTPIPGKVVHSKIAALEKQTYRGPNLRRIREELKIGLDAVASATRVPVQRLEDIEAENFPDLPAEVFTRGFVVAYARHLALDVERVVADYMQRYGEWKAGQVKKSGSRLLAKLTGRK